MAITLDDSVRELVRKHLKEALGDYDFVSSCGMYALSTVMIPIIVSGMLNNDLFREAVRGAMLLQMQKKY